MLAHTLLVEVTNIQVDSRKLMILSFTFKGLLTQVPFPSQKEMTTSAGNLEDNNQIPQQILLSADNGLSTIPADFILHEATSLDCWFLGTALDLAKLKAQELELHQVASDIEDWVKAHPWKAAFYLASALSLVAPEIISIPALEALGFGTAGVRAGEL